jgi:hypothetical protein
LSHLEQKGLVAFVEGTPPPDSIGGTGGVLLFGTPEPEGILELDTALLLAGMVALMTAT